LTTRQKINAAKPAIKPSKPAASISLSVFCLTGWIQGMARDDSNAASKSATSCCAKVRVTLNV
jgi:hypothetical protein